MHPNDDSTWGKHLLRGVGPEERATELRKMRDTFSAVLSRDSLAMYRLGDGGWEGVGLGGWRGRGSAWFAAAEWWVQAPTRSQATRGARAA
jgi:hypothetical protein